MDTQSLQKMLGGNKMIQNVLANPEHMATAQKMMKNPEVRQKIGGMITNPEVMQKAATMLEGLHKVHSQNMNGGRKVRRKKKSRKKKSFRKHYMWNTRGKRYMAKTYKQHLKGVKLGHTHKKPKKRRRRTKKRRRRRRGGISQDMYNNMPEGCQQYGQHHWLCKFQQGQNPVPLETFHGNKEEIEKYCNMLENIGYAPADYCKKGGRKRTKKKRRRRR